MAAQEAGLVGVGGAAKRSEDGMAGGDGEQEDLQFHDDRRMGRTGGSLGKQFVKQADPRGGDWGSLEEFSFADRD